MSGIGMLSRLEPAASAFTQRVDGGWVPEIDMENLAGALGKMTADQSAIVRVLVLNDARSYRHVLSRVRGMLMTGDLTADENIALADMIVKAVVMPSLCPTCDGHSQHMHEARLIVCPCCAGTGRRTARGSDNAEWKLKYSRDYDRCCDVLRGWIGVAGSVMRDEMEG